jgi:hypothetical protein
VRRFVGLARQGETREIGDLPPEHRPQVPAPGAGAIDLAPLEVTEQDDGVEAAPLSIKPSEVIADAAPADALPPERTAVATTDSAVTVMPGRSETVVVHAVPMPVRREPPATEEPAGMHNPGPTDGSAAGAIAVEAETGPERAQLSAKPTADDDVRETQPVTGRVATAPADSDPALPSRTASPPAALHPPATVTKAPAARAPVKRAVPDDDDSDVRSRPTSPAARKRTLASRPQTASAPARAPRVDGTQRIDPRQPPLGQPVFGPNFPYATPNSRQPVFGPHFPYATPQARRQPAARAPQYRANSQPSYGPTYGWR